MIHFDIDDADVKALTSVLGGSLCRFATKVLDGSRKNADSHADLAHEEPTYCLTDDARCVIEGLRSELKSATRTKPGSLRGTCTLARILAAIDRNDAAASSQGEQPVAAYARRRGNPNLANKFAKLPPWGQRLATFCMTNDNIEEAQKRIRDTAALGDVLRGLLREKQKTRLE